MMTKKTLIVTLATLALAGGCKKKEADATKAPPTTGSDKAPTPTPPVADPVKPPVAAPLTGDALAKAYLAAWDAWNAGDKAKYRAAYADNAVSRWPDTPTPERTGGDAIVTASFDFRGGFPDIKATPQIVLVNGRSVAAVYLTTGTNSAPMKTPMGEMPPSNKKIGALVFHTATFNDANQIADETWVMDGNTMAHQLGMSPQPGRAVIEKGADAPVIAIAANSDAEKANLTLVMKGNEDFNKHDVPAMMATWADDAIESDQANEVTAVILPSENAPRNILVLASILALPTVSSGLA